MVSVVAGSVIVSVLFLVFPLCDYTNISAINSGTVHMFSCFCCVCNFQTVPRVFNSACCITFLLFFELMFQKFCSFCLYTFFNVIVHNIAITFYIECKESFCLTPLFRLLEVKVIVDKLLKECKIIILIIIKVSGF